MPLSDSWDVVYNLKSVTIPQWDDPRHERLAKRCKSCRPMGMFHFSRNEFLLCYNGKKGHSQLLPPYVISPIFSEFGLYLNRHGHPSRTKGIIEWEGTAEHVAWHHPYILIFNSRFIEVRHVETGRLRHVIRGNDIRCICDGRGVSIPRIAPGPNGAWEAPSREARVHCVMRADDTSQGRAGPSGVVQHIFDLIPTVPA
jgi:hypothetical protein